MSLGWESHGILGQPQWMSAQFSPFNNSSVCRGGVILIWGEWRGWIILTKGINSPSPQAKCKDLPSFIVCGILLAVEKTLNYRALVLISSHGPSLMWLSSQGQVPITIAGNRITGTLGGCVSLVFLPWPMFYRKFQVHGNEVSGCEITGIYWSGAERAPFFAFLGTGGCVQWT